MTELEKAIMSDNETKDEAIAVTETIEENMVQTIADDTSDIISEEEKTVHIEINRIKKMNAEIAIENETINRNFRELQKPRPVATAPKKRYHYVGTLSASLSLIMMGIAMTISLFSPTGVITALKVAPLMLVFLGLEVGYAMIRNRTARLRYNLKSLILTFLLVIVTFVMSLISVTNTATGGERHYAEERLNNMLSREISEAMPLENVRNVEIELHLYGDDPSEYEDIEDLEDSDIIDLNITYIDADVTMYEFASNCRRILDSLSTMPYNFGSINFIADDDINSYHMEINWLYQSDFSATELIPLVHYFGNDIVMDIPDLSDDE